ncbi:MAG: hypothetical protein MdMp014T_2223 [Treponematales bacterium]
MLAKKWNDQTNWLARKMSGVALAFVTGTALLLAGCGNGNGDDDPAEVDWTNYQTAGTYSIRVKNESNVDLIAFKSSLTASNMLGGVRKNEGDHGFKLDTALFNANSDFSLLFITVDQFNANKGNLAALEQRPFTRLFAMYNATGTNDVPFVISGKLGGNNKLVINNMTSLNMELRQDSPRGTTLGYAPYQALNTTLFMNDGSFYVVPVFKKYNAVRDEVITIYPRNADGLPLGDAFSFTGGNELTISAADYTGNTNLSSGAAFLVVKNSSAQGISVYKGVTEQKTESGISTINSGDERSFTILMPDNGGGNYAASDSFSGWKIVNMGVREKEIPAITTDGGSIAADYRYTVTVTGNWNQSTQAISGLVKGTQKITTEFGE